MSNITLSANAGGSGIFTIASPNSNTNRTLTLPDNTGTLLSSASTFAATGPAFSAYAGSGQNLTNGTFTKIQASTEEFDTNSNYDNATNYRFTPTVAGYYQVNGAIALASNAASFQVVIYKNGNSFKKGLLTNTSASLQQANVIALIYMNGSTDYIELYGFQGSGGTISTVSSSDLTYFQASMVRGA
jgi:hypothetical protein